MDKIPKGYLKGVNKTERVKELKARKAKAEKGSYKDVFPKKTDKEAMKKGIVKKSTFTQKFNKLYPDEKFDLRGFSRKFSIPYASLKEVYDKGLKAWATSGSRAGVPAQAWAIARVYKFILIKQGHLPEPKSDPDAYLRK
jgi:hypothetical protein